MDKSVISTFKENIELAASKYDSISVHLNALRQRVLGAGRPLDAPNPVAPLLHSNEQEARIVESHDGLSSSEDKKLDPKSITSDNELGFCDANSSISGSSTNEDSEVQRSASKDESMKTDSIQEDGSKEKLNNAVQEIVTVAEEIEKKIAGNLESVREHYSSSSVSSSDSDSSTSSDEDNENIYSELLKRIEYEEERRTQTSVRSFKVVEESDSESQESDSISTENNLESNDKRVEHLTFDKSLGERAKQIMESIEEDNEEWGVLEEQLASGKMEEISIDKLFSVKQQNVEQVREDDTRGISREYDNKSIQINRKKSQLTEMSCRKTNSQRTLSSRRTSKDNLNNTSIDSQSYKADSIASSKKSKVSSKKIEHPGKERMLKKKGTNIIKYSSSKNGLKSEKVMKSKPEVQIKSLNTKPTKILKTKSNASKSLPRYIAQKKIQTKPRKDQMANKNETKNVQTKTIYTLKREESIKNIENKPSPSSSNDKLIKQIEALIKSKPDNIFLKKEIDRINESTVNDENGSGDGPDKVRSQAIINSMNQSINKVSKSNVPSHFIKSNKKVENGCIVNSQISNKSNLQNKDSTSKINRIKRNDDSSFKKFTQNTFKNIKLENNQSNMVLTELKKVAGLKPTSSMKESLQTDPKEILAQLEKEVSYGKIKESFIDENELKIATLNKISQTKLPSQKKSEIIWQKDINSDKHNTEDNPTDNKLSSQKATKYIMVEPKLSKHSSRGSKEIKRKLNKMKSYNKLKTNEFKMEHQLKRNDVQKDSFSNETISNMPNKILALNFDGSKPKLTNFPFILGQSTSKSYNIQANVQQTLSIMMMLPSESVRRTLSVDLEGKVSSKASTLSTLTTHSQQAKCPACVMKNDQEFSNDNAVDDPWDNEYTSRNFVRCTCIPRNTVSFKTVMKQLLSESSIGSLLPISETSTLYEESLDRNNENKQLCRRNDLSHLTKLLHATQRIRGRLVT